MVKVLHIVGQMTTGGMETLIMNLYRNIDREKIQFDVLAYYTESGEYDDEIRKLGGNVYVAARSNNPIIFAQRIGKFFEEHHDYIAVHVHTSWLGWVYFKYAEKYGIKKIIHLHAFGSEWKGVLGLTRSILRRYSLKKSDYIFACSAKAAKFSNADLSKTRFFPNGIYTEKFIFNNNIRTSMRKELGVEDKFVILCVARFAPQKNHIFLMEIMKNLVKRSDNIVLLLVGKGPLEQEIRNKVEKENLVDYVRFLGVRKDVNHILQAADAYVMPSLFEGIGISYIEAQAAGVITYASSQAVTEEVKLTELFHDISLNQGADKWAETIWNNREYERKNRKSEIEAAGFDIKYTAEKLAVFYSEGINLFPEIKYTI